MKKYIIILCLGLWMTTFTSCRDEWDNANTDNYVQKHITCPVDLGTPTMTISEFKEAKQDLFAQSNSFQLIEEDIILEGIVIANDMGGNLYQTIVLADIDPDNDCPLPMNCLELALKNTCLYPFFPVGQKVKVNINGLYVGCYSYVPKIGQPYYTSKGNLRLGAALLQMCRTNVYLDGTPAQYKDKISSVFLKGSDAIFTDKKQQNFRNCPMLVTVEGYFTLNDTTKHLADYDEHDDGYGVNRDFKVNGTSQITVRTSTQNEVAYINIPRSDELVQLTGILTYYDGWQIQLCSKDCFFKIPANK
ncbi:MAG: hypothetical protein KBT06_03925 [Prevotellaceae bacterium]|nr:hypothetical protein [Candidatus Colivivens equi]